MVVLDWIQQSTVVVGKADEKELKGKGEKLISREHAISRQKERERSEGES